MPKNETVRRVEVELQFFGSDSVVYRDGGLHGGVPAPRTEGQVGFTLHHQVTDEDGTSIPAAHKVGVVESFQLNVCGTSEGFAELGRYFLALSVLDTSIDPEFHEHFDDIKSSDGHTIIDVIVRKQLSSEPQV